MGLRTGFLSCHFLNNFPVCSNACGGLYLAAADTCIYIKPPLRLFGLLMVGIDPSSVFSFTFSEGMEKYIVEAVSCVFSGKRGRRALGYDPMYIPEQWFLGSAAFPHTQNRKLFVENTSEWHNALGHFYVGT